MRRLLVAALVFPFLSVPVFADPQKETPASTELQKEVEKLIEKLGDEEFTVRDKAAKRILEIGADALPTLRKALDHPDAEVKRRLAEMVPAIEISTALSPKIVNLNADKQTLKQIFDDLTKQTGYRYEYFNNNPNQTYSFKFDKKPIWQVLDTIGAETGMAVQQSFQDEVVRLQQQDTQVPYVSYDGPFRAVATGFQLVKNNDFGALQRSNPLPGRSSTLTLNIMLFAEPRTPMLSVGQGMVTTAYDEDKNSMNPDDGDKSNPNSLVTSRSFYRNGGSRMYNSQASVNLLMPADSSRKVKYIKGNVPVTLVIAQKQELLTSEVLKAKGKQYTAGNITISVDDVTENPGGGIALKMVITNADNKSNPNDYTWQNSIYQRLEVQDAEGHKFNHGGSSWGGGGPGQMNMTLNLTPPVGAKPGAAAKLLFQAWTTMQTSMTFEFKDLPLP